MAKIESVCVFCGSRVGTAPARRALAEETGRRLAEAGLRTVYGGGHVGLMGVLADAALAAGGKVVGVIPEFLHEREVMHSGLTELLVTRSMHERKAEMHARSDAFLVLPGGIGTLDEVAEALSWISLDLHRKPVILVDRAFWSPLSGLLSGMESAGFVSPDLLESTAFVDSAGEALALLSAAGARA